MKNIFLFSLLLIFQITVIPQQPEFNLSNYKEFLNTNQNMDYNDLLNSYPAGSFETKVNTDNNSAFYLDSISIKR